MFERFGRISYCAHTKVEEFVRHLESGRLMGSCCAACGQVTFPPRADCAECRHGEFTFTELNGRGTVVTHTRIESAPAGFEAAVPFDLAVVDLDEGGRLLAGFGATIAPADIAIGMAVQVVPRINEETEESQVDYTLERPGTGWTKSDLP